MVTHGAHYLLTRHFHVKGAWGNVPFPVAYNSGINALEYGVSDFWRLMAVQSALLRIMIDTVNMGENSSTATLPSSIARRVYKHARFGSS